MKIVPFDYIFEIPEAIAVCPYCQQKMYADVQEWTEENKELWTASSIEISCESEPEDFQSGEYDDYIASHLNMPYVYLFPVVTKIKDYINDNFRFIK